MLQRIATFIVSIICRYNSCFAIQHIGAIVWR